MMAVGVVDHGVEARLQQLRNKLIKNKNTTTTTLVLGEGNFTSPPASASSRS